ncbi:MAG: polysaccharide biosynthesis tyrosine autokinase [Acidobacteriaceae bacterium]|nr:polysaccharide biosynthesis tyrosine autokinase [Acidobacteriaceae bacterium]
MYRASTALEIQDNKNDAGARLLSPTADSTSVESLTDVPTQIRILQGKTLIERALAKAGMARPEDRESSATETGFWHRVLPSAENDRDTLVERTEKHLKVSQSGQTRVVEVSFDAKNPVVAARFANALTAEFIEQNLQARWEMNHRTAEWLIGQLDDLRSKLKHSEDALQTYARQKGLIYTGNQQSVSEEKLRELQMELSKAQASRVEKQSQSEIAHSASTATVPEVLNDSNLRAIESSLTDLHRQEAELAVTFKPDYAKAKRLRAEIEALESTLQAKRTQIVDRVDNELQESERREQLLSAAYARQTRSVVEDSEKAIQYDMLKNEVDSNRQVYQAMLQRVKESSIVAAMKEANVRVLDPAKPPAHPFKPTLPFNSGAGLACGLIIGAALIVVRKRTDVSVQNPGDAAMLLGVPELGVIPAAGIGAKRVESRTQLLLGEKQIEAPGVQIGAYTENSGVLADSFRSVLASILFAGARQRRRVLVLTSANPGEGKTTTAINLAATLANMNRKVLLIDGDMRSPRLHTAFGLENSIGLSNVLQEIAIKQTPTIPSGIRETGIPNLDVLTSGPAVQAGADLLFSASMPALIAQCREKYSMILIDTPPMLLMPDARALARAADAVVLIARAGRTDRNAIQAAYRRFVEDQTPVLGVVLNDWNAKMSTNNYYAGYSDYKDSAAGQPAVVVSPAGA